MLEDLFTVTKIINIKYCTLPVCMNIYFNQFGYLFKFKAVENVLFRHRWAQTMSGETFRAINVILSAIYYADHISGCIFLDMHISYIFCLSAGWFWIQDTMTKATFCNNHTYNVKYRYKYDHFHELLSL